MKYNNHLNYQDRRRFLFKVRLVLFCILGLGVLAVIYIYFSVVVQRDANTEDLTTSGQTSGYFAPSVNIFRSPYFQFQAGSDWAEVSTESNANKYVYRSLRSNLIEHELVVYVNQIPANLTANHVLPVNPKGVGELLPLAVSEHCSKVVVAPSARPQEVLQDRVKYLCHSDSTNYTALVGLVEHSTSLQLPRPDGSTATYSILYTNLKATPDSSQLTQIADSFQTR